MDGLNLEELQSQLDDVKTLLENDPRNEDLIALQTQLEEILAMQKEIVDITQPPLLSVSTLDSEESDTEDIFGQSDRKRKRSTPSTDTPPDLALKIQKIESQASGSSSQGQSSSLPPQAALSTETVEKVSRIQEMVQTSQVSLSGFGVLDAQIPPPINQFQAAALHPSLLANLQAMQFTAPTPIQRKCFNVMATAQTGTGKTGAYLIPFIDKLLKSPPQRPLHYSRLYPFSLVLAPTRELALQIGEQAKALLHGTSYSAGVIYGGTSYEDQVQALVLGGCDILIGTPGRVLDVLGKGRLSLAYLQVITLDEADRMLDMGFEKDIRGLLQHPDVPKQHQLLMFSATFPKSIRTLAQEFLRKYVFIRVGAPGATAATVKQVVWFVQPQEKTRQLLYALKLAQGLTLVFVETKKRAESISGFLLRRGMPAVAIHGNLSQTEREQALLSFKSGQSPILVATDVASRGLDVPDVQHVINFDLPNQIEDYVHRIGRTARLGSQGLATSFYSPDNRKLCKALVRTLTKAGQEVPTFLQREIEAKETENLPIGPAVPPTGTSTGPSEGADDLEHEMQALEREGVQ